MTEHSTDLPFFGGSFDVSMGSQLAWGVGFCVFWAVVIELWLKLNVPWLAKQSFWKGGAQDIQRKLLNNFGFPSEPTPPKFPEGLTEAFVTESWSAAVVYSFTHAACVAPCVPVGIYGWEAVSAEWRTAFVLGALGDLGFTLYDELKTTWRALCWQSFQKMTGQAPVTTRSGDAATTSSARPRLAGKARAPSCRAESEGSVASSETDCKWPGAASSMASWSVHRLSE